MDQSQISENCSRKNEQLDLLVRVMNNVNSAEHDTKVVESIIHDIRSYLKCDATAIRISKDGHFPYFHVFGFDKPFVQTETDLRSSNSSICNEQCGKEQTLECLCGAVLTQSSKLKDIVTPFGSFVTGDINNFATSHIEDITIRNVCGKSGYYSVALVPLYTGHEIIGLLQCNDKRKNFFSPDEISFLEKLSSSLALAIKRKEEIYELHTITERFKQIREIGKTASWEINLNTGYFTSVEGMDTLFDYEFIPGKTKIQDFLTERIHKDDLDALLERMASIKNETPESYDYRAYTNNSEIKYFRSFGNLKNGFLQGISIDITEYQKTKIEAEESHAFLQSIVNGLKTAIIVIDPLNNRVIETNSVAQNLFQMSDEELKKVHGTVLMSVRYFKKAKSIGTVSEDMQSNEEAMLKQNDGTLIPVQKIVMKVFLQDKMHYVVILFDISRHKQLEQQLTHSQKMESIGSLAAGVAHEINTPIQYIGDNGHFLQESFRTLLDVIKKYQELMTCIEENKENANEACHHSISELKTLQEDGDIDFLLDEIPEAITQSIDGVNRVSTIVQAMKKFSHPGQSEMTLADINEIIQNTVIVARNEWKYVADLNTDLLQNVPEIPMHSDDISQVILNLVVNAAHAIGDIVADGEKGQINIKTAYDDDFVTITIEDTGSGIAPENYDKIFNPFFTTKEVGRGTGQGLSMAYSIITEKHKGSLSFQSEVNKGTTFIINLPRK